MDDGLLPLRIRTEWAWYAVYCHPRCEFRANSALMAADFATFLPTERKWVRHARYKHEKIVPLLSRYLFVGCIGDNFPRCYDMDGIHGLLSNDGRPVPIPAEIITELMASCKFGEFDETTAVARLPIGSQVQIMAGPLRGFVAELKRADSADKRAEIFVNMLGRACHMRLKFQELRPI